MCCALIRFPAERMIQPGFVGEYHLSPLVYRLALVISAPLQPLLSVDSRKMKFHDGGSSMISCFIELIVQAVLVETVLFRCWFNSTVTLAAVDRCVLPAMRFNARRSLSVSLEVRPELFWLLGFLNSVLVLDMAALEKPSSSAVLVSEAPTIWSCTRLELSVTSLAYSHQPSIQSPASRTVICFTYSH